MGEERILSYPEAINEALIQVMEKYPNSIVMGEGVDDPKRILGTTKGLEKFSKERFFDTPLAEEAMTGVAIGMAMAGNYVVHNHIRQDFLLLAMNQLVNMAAKMRYMYGGRVNIPLTVRACIGKSWGQGPQHSQSLYPLFMNIPGIKIVAPTNPYDAKGLLIKAFLEKDPVLFIEHRHLYYQKGNVPEEFYEVPFGKARFLKKSQLPKITLVGVSQMAIECLRAARLLEDYNIDCDVIDVRSLNPLDISSIIKSVYFSRKLVFVDCAWKTCGLGAEVISQIKESFDMPFIARRMGFAETVCPTSKVLENEFYPNAEKIAEKAFNLLDRMDKFVPKRKLEIEEIEFKGPF